MVKALFVNIVGCSVVVYGPALLPERITALPVGCEGARCKGAVELENIRWAGCLVADGLMCLRNRICLLRELYYDFPT